MSNIYAAIDSSPLLHYLFHPRAVQSKPPGKAYDLEITVAENIKIMCRAYPGSEERPWLLYFHGNGEVVSDYDGIAPLYNRSGLNLLVTDYRGYGASGGEPSFQNMITDACRVFEHLQAEEADSERANKWFVMGRSLGSIPALELAKRYSASLQGLIIESGFMCVSRLIDHLGLPAPAGLPDLEEKCRQLVSGITLPALVLHGEQDRLVPVNQGRELLEALGSAKKEMVLIPRADHNDIIFIDAKRYMEAICVFVEEVQQLC